MTEHLHLVVDFDEVWCKSAMDAPGLRRLEAYLNCHPRIVLTLLSAATLHDVLAGFGTRFGALPHTWVTEDGASIHILRADGTYEEDLQYAMATRSRPDDICEFPGSDCAEPKAASLSGVDPRALAVLFLEACRDAPRPRLIIGDRERDDRLLKIADYPVPSSRILHAGGSVAENIVRELMGVGKILSSRTRGPRLRVGSIRAYP